MAYLSSILGSAGIGGAIAAGCGMDCSGSRLTSWRVIGASPWLSPRNHWTPRCRSNDPAPR